MSITVLPQLVEAEALLSEQEAELMQQLAAIQEQRKGLQTVITMFDTSSASNGYSTAADVTSTIEVSVEDTNEDIDTDEDVDTDAEEGEETVADRLAKVMKSKITARKSKTTKTGSAKTGRKSTSAKKVDGRSAHWQRYVLDEHQQQRLPDVVATILKTKPKDSFKITDVMSAIFEDDMPKAQYLKARSRISNILSAGARDNDWYRGRGGTYSLSMKAVKTS